MKTTIYSSIAFLILALLCSNGISQGYGPGEVATGDAVELEPVPEGPTILDSYRVYYDKEASTAAIRSLLAAPVSSRERVALEERLAKLD